MRITITKVLSSQPIPMGNLQTPGYCITFESEMLAGQAIFVPTATSANLSPGQHYFVETDYESIENCRIWTQADPPPLLIRSLSQPGDYELVAAVQEITLLTDDENLAVVDVAVGEIAFVLTANEIGGAVPSVGDVISCTVRALSLWDAAL